MKDVAEKARLAELDRALRLIRRGHDPTSVVEDMSRRLMNKLLHAPTKAFESGVYEVLSPTRGGG